MVGTRKVPVMRWVFTMWKNLSASKPLFMTKVPLCISTATMMAPAAWVIGVMARKRTSCGQSHSASSIVTMVTWMRWVWMTPLGLPVVPPV